MSKTFGFSTDDMLKFYSNFDPIKFKYKYDEKNIVWKKYLYMQELEQAHQFASLTKKDYASEAANFDMVYDEKDKSKQHIQLLHLISEKIINQYINIDGVERLFSDSYIEFEWEMHFSADYEKHGMVFYRDHFIHQIRDAFMMHILLEEFGFYEKTKRVLMKESESKVSRYVCKMIKQQKDIEMNKMKRIYDDDFYIRNLIYMSSYMSGLFHDIGYPESYFISTNRHISNYIPEVHNFNGASGDLKRIFSLLQNSLLFRVVPFEEIERRLQDNKNPNHGALSAIIFLLHFYENGAIYRLEPYKVAAVELAGLAIYNHTNKYGIVKGGIMDVYRPCFTLNPISYILRICDDLQEWERIYFLISNAPSILFCNRCKTPIIRESIKNNAVDLEYRYKCNCAALTMEDDKDCIGFKRAFDKEHKFHYRRLYNISVCDEVKFVLNEKETKLDVCLDYDLYKLLHAAYINPDFAFYRILELNELKKLLIAQREIPQIYLDYTITANPLLIKTKILEEYLMDKVKSEEFLTICNMYNKNDINDRYVELENKCIGLCATVVNEMVSENSMCHLCKKYESIGNGICEDSDCKITKLKDYINRSMNLYINLYLCMNIYKIKNAMYSKNKIIQEFLFDRGKNIIEFYVKEPLKGLVGHEEKYSELQCLIEDCFLQFSKMFSDTLCFNQDNSDYLNLYSAGECHNYLYNNELEYESIHYYHNAQKSYVNRDNYMPFFNRMDSLGKIDYDYIDAYTDLYLFSKMHRKKIAIRKYIKQACTENDVQVLKDSIINILDSCDNLILDFTGIEEFKQEFFDKYIECFKEYIDKIPIIGLYDESKKLYDVAYSKKVA